MKKVLITLASMVGIIAVRMILSVAFSEQVAKVFTSVSISFLFFYLILTICSFRKGQAKSVN
ncbi:MAG: hypothetical protein K2L82_08615 [Lachnospiraceae bacterium]|nr:hypothetical protein [Lachnospiraceae bacterium]